MRREAPATTEKNELEEALNSIKQGLEEFVSKVQVRIDACEPIHSVSNGFIVPDQWSVSERLETPGRVRPESEAARGPTGPENQGQHCF